MLEIVSQQFSLSTLDDAKNYFVGETGYQGQIEFSSDIASGVYRVVRGELCRVVVGDLTELAKDA